MPISLLPDGPPTHLIALVTGNLTLAELTGFVVNVRSGEDQRQRPLLVDLTNGATDMSSNDLQQFAAHMATQIKQTGPRGPVALLAPTDAVYGVLRMLISHCENAGVEHIAVFRTRVEAEVWIAEQSDPTE